MTRGPCRGFTLVELAVVLAIVGLLLGMILVPLGTQWQLRQVRQEQQDLGHIRDALLGFAATQGRLPCPDTDFDGVEDIVGFPPAPLPTPVVCTDTAAFLPFADLGVPPGDAWSRLRLYQVAPAFVMVTLPGAPAPLASNLDLQDTSAITVQQRLADKSLITLSGPAAAVISLGNNGFGGRTVDGDVIPAPPAADETENTDDDTTLITRLRTGDQAAGACSDTAGGQPFCEFDDLVIWVPESILFNRLIQSGRLP